MTSKGKSYISKDIDESNLNQILFDSLSNNNQNQQQYESEENQEEYQGNNGFQQKNYRNHDDEGENQSAFEDQDDQISQKHQQRDGDESNFSNNNASCLDHSEDQIPNRIYSNQNNYRGNYYENDNEEEFGSDNEGRQMNKYGIQNIQGNKYDKKVFNQQNHYLDTEEEREKGQEVDPEIVKVINNIHCPINELSLTSNSNNSTPQKVFPLHKTKRSQNTNESQQLPHFKNNNIRFDTDLQGEDDLEGGSNSNFDWGGNGKSNMFPEINAPTMELSNENSAVFSQYQKQALKPTFLQQDQEIRDQSKLILQQNQEYLSNIFYQHIQQPQQQTQQHQFQAQRNQPYSNNQNNVNSLAKQYRNQKQSDVQESNNTDEQQQQQQKQQQQLFQQQQQQQQQQKGYDNNNLREYYEKEGENIQSQNISRSIIEDGSPSKLIHPQSQINEDQKDLNDINNDDRIKKIQKWTNTKENDHLKEILEQKNQEINNLVFENSQLYARFNEAEEQAQFIKLKYKDQSSLEQLRGRRLDMTQRELEKYKSLIQEKEFKVSELEEELDSLKLRLNETEMAIESELREIKQEERKQKVVTESYKNLVKEKDGELELFKEKIRVLQVDDEQRISNVSKELNELRKILNERDNQIHQQQEQFIQFAQEITEKNQILKENEEESKRNNKVIKEMREKLDVIMLKQHDAEQLKSYTGITGSEGIDQENNSNKKSMAMDEEILRIKKGYEREIAKLKEELAFSQMKEAEAKQMQQKEQITAVNVDEKNQNQNNQTDLEVQIFDDNLEVPFHKNKTEKYVKLQPEQIELEQNISMNQQDISSSVIEAVNQIMNNLGIFYEFNFSNQQQSYVEFLNTLIEQVALKIKESRKVILEITQQHEKIVLLQQELKLSKNEKEQIQQQLKNIQLNSSSSKEVKQLQKTIENLELTIKTLEKAKQDQEEDSENVREQANDILNQYHFLRNENNNLRALVQDLQAELEEVRIEANRWQENINQRELENQMNLKLENVLEQLQAKELDIQELAIQKQEVQEEAEELRLRLLQIEQNREEISEKSKNSQEINLKSQMERFKIESKREADKMKVEIKELRGDKERLESQIKTQANCLKMIEKERDLLADEKKSVRHLEQELHQLKEEMKLKTEEVKHLLKISKENEESLKEKILKAESSSSSKKFSQQDIKSPKNNEDELEQLRQINDKLEFEIEEFKNDIQGFQREKERMSAERDRLEGEKDKLEKSGKEKDKKNIELFGNVKVLTEQSKKAEMVMQTSKEEVEKTKRQLGLKALDLKNANAKCQELHKENMEIQTKLQQVLQFKRQKEEEDFREKEGKQSKEKILEREKAELSAKLDELNQQNQTLLKKIEKLSDQNQQITQQIKHSASQIQELNQDNQELQQQIQTQKYTNSSNHLPITQNFSPEMLSSEETVTLMLDILHRTTKSTEMSHALAQSDEFIDLLEQIRQINLNSSSIETEKKQSRALSSASSSNYKLPSNQQQFQQTNYNPYLYDNSHQYSTNQQNQLGKNSSIFNHQQQYSSINSVPQTNYIPQQSQQMSLSNIHNYSSQSNRDTQPYNVQRDVTSQNQQQSSYPIFIDQNFISKSNFHSIPSHNNSSSSNISNYMSNNVTQQIPSNYQQQQGNLYPSNLQPGTIKQRNLNMQGHY